jgi:hypothetical protein
MPPTRIPRAVLTIKLIPMIPYAFPFSDRSYVSAIIALLFEEIKPN